MAQQKQQPEMVMTARQISHEIQLLLKALGPEEFQRVFEQSLLGWIKALPEEKKKQKLLLDLYPTLPDVVQQILTQETGFTMANSAE
ncbi:MAG: hypothetical protein HXX11_19510 [Desulfuromonadales bacterium]|nr:hypothetical protein [Desulfuromonadales bacterium]